MSEISGMFRDWKFEYYTAKHPEKGYELWICNGFGFFRDYCESRTATPLLVGTSRWLRWRIWRELKRERRRRAENRIKELVAPTNPEHDLTEPDERREG